MSRGRFITLEGIEGSGKSTQAERLVAALAALGYPVLRTREPGGTAIGGRIRALLLDPESAGMDPWTELLLYCADRAEHVGRVIRPALERGDHVICDRFSDATRAYQGLARGLGLDAVDRANVAHFEPDLTVVFDLPAADGLARAQRRNQTAELDRESRFEHEALEFHERVRDGYLQLARAAPARFHLLDASGSPDAVFTELFAEVRHLLGPPPGRQS